MRLGKVVVVGGSGMVGRVLLEVLNKHNFQPQELIITGQRTVGQIEETPYGELTVQELTAGIFDGASFVFWAAGAAISKEWINRSRTLRTLKRFHIDLSSAFRYDPEVPLVIPAINGNTIGMSDVIACPNCTTAIALMALAPIHWQAQLTKVNLVTYQAASGAGKDSLDALGQQVAQWAKKGEPPSEGKTGDVPWPLAGNLFPFIDTFEPEWDGFTREEMKTAWEIRKILLNQPLNDRSVPITSTCVRVPVQRCHSEVITFQTKLQLSPAEVVEILNSKSNRGVSVVSILDKRLFAMPLFQEGLEEVAVSRIRRTDDRSVNEMVMWVCGDQLLRGAALTAVEVAEYILSNLWNLEVE